MAFNKEKVMDAARKFVDKGQIDKAVREYLRIVHEDPKDVRVWLKIGDLYAKKGAKQEAIDTYLKVARFYHEQGFFLKAVAVYKQILKLDPRLVDVVLKLAELYRQLGLMSDAMQHFESVAAHFHREGNTKEALATVKKLVDLDPENIATRIKLAELYSKESLVEEAAREFAVACDQLRAQGRQDDFIKVAERLLWHKPDNIALHRELAGLYLRRNDPRRALQKLQSCFKADPRDVDTLGLLAQAFQALEQKAKTVSVLKELARILVENKQRDRALDVHRKILEFVPNDAEALAFVGQAKPARASSVPMTPSPAMPPPPIPPPRASTPIPQVVRAATADARFNFTTDLPAMSARMTGSMPLVDEQSFSDADFALPEYDDADFSADMEPAPDPRTMSAAGEQHAEEIAKILAETDVYVKYGLHQKAVDHLRRVFTLDPDNVEAHERLKDIFVAQGREQEAEAELLRLAELVAPADPDRAEAYLHELLAMNGTHTGAFDLARRFRLRVARMSSVSAEVEYGGGVAAIDAEPDDLGLAPPRRGPALGVARPRDSVDEFDPDDLIPVQVAHGSPTPQRPPGPPADSFDLEFDPMSQATRQMSADHVEALAQHVRDSLDEPMIPDSASVAWPMEPPTFGAADAQLVEDDQIDHEIPFDPAEARAFDAAVGMAQAEDGYGAGYEDPDLPAITDAQHAAVAPGPFDDVTDDPLAVAGSYDPYGTEAVQTPPFDPTASHPVAPIDDVIPPPRAESLVEDDLDEADFYVSQGMYPEALDVLRALLERYPGHRLVTAKYHEVEAMLHPGAMTGTDALDLEEIEEMPIDDLEEVPAAPSKRRPTVMLEKPVDESDAETHYDLGLAYKEMGLHDEAIKAFEKVLRAPGREAQCRVMLGMCQREMGNPTEAIHQFKQGLHADPTDRERQSLYYEIGATYEQLGDDAEALYFYEMVIKRDPSFADASARADRIRAQAARGGVRHDRDL